jgi:uncharacterized protein YigE (DUF2233 family)
MRPSARIQPAVLLALGCLLGIACLRPEIATAHDLQWEPLAEGLAVSVWKPGATCAEVPPSLVADIDPARYRFSVHFYGQEGLDQPPTIEEWQKRTGHHLLFNAGLFRENFSYLGLLYKDGRPLSGRRHTTWQGLFVAEPTTRDSRHAGVLDLSVDTFDEHRPAYKEAAQALMLLDRDGRVRVRQTGKRAFQTVVAETAGGHILVFKSLDPVTLYDLGACMKDGLPFIRQVMAMDGGSSSDLLIPESLWKGRGHGPPAWKSLFAGTTAIHIPLPAVIGISPR